MSSPMFLFRMSYVLSRAEHYYWTDWHLSTPATVFAANQEQAFEKLQGLLGDPPPHKAWSMRIKSVEEMPTGDRPAQEVE